MIIDYMKNVDCLIGMKDIPDKSIDMICADLPYGITHNKWDAAIPLAELWKGIDRIIKDTGTIILFASGMFTADLMQSNRKNWRYNLVWEKMQTECHSDHTRIFVFFIKKLLHTIHKSLLVIPER